MKLWVMVEGKDIALGGFQELVDGVCVVGLKINGEENWRAFVEQCANELPCDVIIELPDGELETVSRLADIVCKWQSKLVPQFPMTKEGMIACKRFSSSGVRVAVRATTWAEFIIAMRMSPTFMRAPIEMFATDDEEIDFDDAMEIGSQLQKALEHYGYGKTQLLIEADEESIHLLFALTPSGLLLPFELLKTVLK